MKRFKLALFACLQLLLLAAAAILFFDYMAALTYVPPLRLGIAAIAVILLAFSLYAFALLSRYENTLGRTLKNAAVLCGRDHGCHRGGRSRK